MTPLELVIFDPDPEAVRSLRSALGLPFVSIVQGNGKQAAGSSRLDALWLTWMQAEQFGVTPIVEPHSAVVSSMAPSFVSRGFPPFVVAGVSFDKTDSPDLAERLRVCLKAVLRAIRLFNDGGGGVIQRLGTIPENLLLNRLSPSTVSAELERAWHQEYASSAAGPLEGREDSRR